MSTADALRPERQITKRANSMSGHVNGFQSHTQSEIKSTAVMAFLRLNDPYFAGILAKPATSGMAGVVGRRRTLWSMASSRSIVSFSRGGSALISLAGSVAR
jgi:hypothetical protein